MPGGHDDLAVCAAGVAEEVLTPGRDYGCDVWQVGLHADPILVHTSNPRLKRLLRPEAGTRTIVGHVGRRYTANGAGGWDRV